MKFSGGQGGGGDGTVIGSGTPGNGAANTGGGGGGTFPVSSSTIGLGGSGVVIIRYPSGYTLSVGAGLTSSTVTVGANKVTTFTAGSDTISFS